MRVNRCVEMDAEERHLQAAKCYKLGKMEFSQGIDIEEPPFYLEDYKIEAWMMGWRTGEYESNVR